MVSHQHTDDSDSDRKLQFWPLIKKIHVYIRAPLLKYGVTLIDLPGTHDANAGRAAIAEKHMKECTHFFIIADIKRAMDNSTAKQLISELFTNKGETATNDMVENVSFVCTSSDNIDKSETYSALAVFRKEMEAVEDHLEALKRQHVEAIKAEKRYKEEVILVDTQLRKAGKRLSVWMRRKNQARKKNWQWPVYFMKKLNSAIRNSSRKRKRADSEETPTKRQKQEDFGYEVPDSDAEDDDDEDEDESEESDDDDDDDDVEFSDDTVPAPTLAKNPDELQEIIKQFRAIKETLRKQKTAAKRAQAAESDRIPILAQEVADLEVSISERCVAARNAFVRKKIKQQYAYIIEEADEELKENAGPNSSNFELSRNYRAIEEQFRVFCVSSHGYQKLQGRLGGKDGKFQNLEATEIPALQRHVHDLAKQPHRVAAVDFSAQFSKFLNSFNIWRTSEEDRGAEGTLSEKYRAAKTVETALDAMKKVYLPSPTTMYSH
ncbi:hypothetical protein BJ508DRAFT_128687 [Ascobolus immersus RN42]|uniref:Dynamin N-terminal domain-containing protein n=1 Tax=Ascobolus immersus RN42 TaxID=1160509 RepID=A0A3N4I3K3_ASCIM|nr:hypothetical protein BJ508DRAFT_128687 [Ascobolus immersus RN42]